MIKLIPLLLISFSLYGETPPPESQCRSQLMRMQIDNNAINGALQNSQEVQSRALPALQTYLSSESFRSSFMVDYPLPAVGFPFDHELCLREKARDPLFRDVNCEDPQLCGTSPVPEEIKTRLCFALPCSFVMGSRMDQCPANATARPKSMTFTSPVSLRSVNLVPENVTIDRNIVRSCFKVSNLDVGLGVGIEFENQGTPYDSIALNNLNLNLDGERKICLTANLDLTKNPVLSGVALEHTGGGPFISDAMIDRALRGSTVSGLSGYTPQTLEILKMTGLPPMARHFRPTIENAVAEVLSKTFETTVAGYMSGLTENKGPTRVDTPADSMVSELGVGNLAVKKYVDLLDCSLMKREGLRIPADNACLTTNFTGSNTVLYNQRSIPTPERAIEKLEEAMGRNSNVTSENIKRRLTDFGERMRRLNLSPLYDRKITPIINQIAVTQSNSTLMSGIELVGQLSSESQLSVGFCLPEICDQQRPSSHEGRSIPNCPIQTYVDINELNNLLKAMYDSGRLCHRGRGDFVPERNSRGVIQRDRGLARGQGCLFAVEEDPDGLRCYLNGPPTMKYDPATRRYNVDMKTRECFRGGVFIGQGKIGGDINFNIGFTPSICNGGDFCLENGVAEWNVVPGTAQHALRESSWLNGLVRQRIDSNLREIVSKSIRFPLSSTQGPLANIPVTPDGRVDMGDGYFGACLRIR